MKTKIITKTNMKTILTLLLLNVSAATSLAWANLNCADSAHAAMGHCQEQTTNAIPISDGSIEETTHMPFHGMMDMNDDPVLTKVTIHRLEWQKADEGSNPVILEADAWVGKDLKKFWLKAEVERVGNITEEAELQALYGYAASPYWDVLAGIRKDFKPVSREWLTVGVKGLAPNFIDVDAALFIDKDGQTAARLHSEYELMLTQKTLLLPEVELNLYGQDDPEAGIGAGLSNAKLGLRLSHEFKRELATYIGVEWSKQFGRTADLAQAEGEETEHTRVMIGVSGWF